MTPSDLQKEAERICRAIIHNWKPDPDDPRIDEITNILRAIHDAAIEKAAQPVRGEISLYEQEAVVVSENRKRKIQSRWFKLKEIERRITALKIGDGK